MSPQERDYYRQRAKAERLCAERTSTAVAAVIHNQLAELYDNLVELDETPDRPKLRIATPERRSA